jgi:hypothetical protein
VRDSSGSIDTEAQPSGPFEPLEVRTPDANGLEVGIALEDDQVVRPDRVVQDGRQVVERSEGGYNSPFTIGEGEGDLLIPGQADRAAELGLQSGGIDLTVRRKDSQDRAPGSGQKDALGDPFAGDVQVLGALLGSEGRRMEDGFKTDPLLGQVAEHTHENLRVE